ncbi:hypothetical protein ACWDPV_06750 [Gordonia sp. NPDC003504]
MTVLTLVVSWPGVSAAGAAAACCWVGWAAVLLPPLLSSAMSRPTTPIVTMSAEMIVATPAEASTVGQLTPPPEPEPESELESAEASAAAGWSTAYCSVG